jgi:Right handed beta helix region
MLLRLFRWSRPAASALSALALLGGCLVTSHAEGLTLYVATNGNDAWSGRTPKPGGKEGPLATLAGARDAIRKLKAEAKLPAGGVTVEIRGGAYTLAEPFALTAEDSGTEAAPIAYRARKGEQVRLLAGKVVKGFRPVTDTAVLGRLEESARGKVYQTDLRAQGITDYGKVDGGGLELFYNAQPMTVARWPNEGFVKIADVLNIDPVDVRGTKGDMGGRFVYEGDRPKRWVGEKDLWLHGYWFWDWSDQRMKVESIDTDKRIITLAPPQHGYGYRRGQWYYALNALCELDAPGEWYLDRDTGILYFYPPSPIETGEALVSVLPNVISLNGASHVTVQGLLMEASRDSAVVVQGATGSRVAACTVRNVGGQGVAVSGGTNCGVVGCDIYQTAKGGISLDGGDRTTLTPAGLYAENNHIHHFARWYRMYNGGIHLNGVGNRASHNLIDNAPHTAIFFGGNDHLIELNELHSVCYESNDAGAMYAGRNWTMRGTVIRYNYLHHISGFEGRGCVGMYLDDMWCGTVMQGNVCYKVTNAAFIGGGRDNAIDNNIFVDCNPAVHVDARAMGWAKYHTDGWVQELTEKQTHLGIALLKSPYIDRYPALSTLTTGNPYAPEGNVISRNICWGGVWEGVEGAARPFLKYENNLVNVDPHFVDAEHGNFQLRDDSPAYKLGFQRIPVEEIGLYNDPLRASWPVKSVVREMPTPPPPQKPARTGPPQVFRAPHLARPFDPWADVRYAQGFSGTGIVIEQGIAGEKVKPASAATIGYTDADLFVAIHNTVDASEPLRKGNTWGQDDAVEIAIRDTALGKSAPIIVLRGYPSGHFESSTEAGAPEAVAKRAAQGVEYRARVESATQWTAEWRIPFASLGIDPRKHTRLAFNVSVRKTAPEPFWLMWQGTNACTWEVGNAGILELAK